MSPSLLIFSPRYKNVNGFTLVESLVAMAIFMLGFSGLYVFYTMSQVLVKYSEQRLYLNLMGDRIIQTIAAGSQLGVSDNLNPFTNPDCYSGNLNICPSNSPADETSCANVRQSWMYDICSNVGPLSNDSKLDLYNDGTGLIVNISLVTINGQVSTYLTRKIRQP